MTTYKETERKIKGQWFTPDTIADDMVKMTPESWWTEGILEPTCGDGNLVIRILNEKVNHGLSPEEALRSTFANELDKRYADQCTERVRAWAKDQGIDTDWICMNEDAKTFDFSQLPYEYVWTNLPFGSWKISQLPAKIAKNTVKNEAILISKATSFSKFVREYRIVDFPGIAFKAQISHYDRNCKESKSWLDKYKPLIADRCKWEVRDDSYTHVAVIYSNHPSLLRLFSREYYYRKGKVPSRCILLKLTDEEYKKLTEYTDVTYEEYNREFRLYLKRRNQRILYGFINKALSENSEASTDQP